MPKIVKSIPEVRRAKSKGGPTASDEPDGEGRNAKSTPSSHRTSTKEAAANAGFLIRGDDLLDLFCLLINALIQAGGRFCQTRPGRVISSELEWMILPCSTPEYFPPLSGAFLPPGGGLPQSTWLR